MSKVRLTGSTSGYTELTAPATAGNNTLVLPAGNGSAGQVLQTNGSGALVWAHGASSAPAFSAKRSGVAQTPTASQWTKVQLNAKDFDNTNAFDSVTNFRFTPQVPGYYIITGNVRSTINSTTLIAAIYKNGVSYQTGSRVEATTNVIQSVATCVLYLNGSTDYIELFGYASSNGFSDSGDTRMSGALLVPA